jgi:hypothetical protein
MGGSSATSPPRPQPHRRGRRARGAHHLRRTGPRHRLGPPATTWRTARSSSSAGAARRPRAAARVGPATAIVGGNSTTIGTMYALREAGPRVPDDVALVAFVDFGWADLFSPRLTTLARPLHAIGAKGGSAAAQAARDPSVPPRTTRLPPELRHRHSCGCRRRAPRCRAARTGAGWGGYRRAEEPHQSPSTRRPSSPAGTRPRRRAGMWLMSVVAGHSRCFRSPSC